MTPSEYRKMIGGRIKAAREKKSWKLRDLHGAIGFRMSMSRLGNYEAGLRVMPPWEAHILANALSVRAGWLLCLDEGQLMLTPEEEKLLRYWRALPENERAETAESIEVRALRYMKPVSEAKVRKRTPRRAPAP